MMKKIIHILFLSCLKATELIEKKIHFKLSYKEELQLKVHKMMCNACTSFAEQSEFLEKGIENQCVKLHPNIDIQQLKKQIELSLKEQEQ